MNKKIIDDVVDGPSLTPAQEKEVKEFCARQVNILGDYEKRKRNRIKRFWDWFINKAGN